MCIICLDQIEDPVGSGITSVEFLVLFDFNTLSGNYRDMTAAEEQLLADGRNMENVGSVAAGPLEVLFRCDNLIKKGYEYFLDLHKVVLLSTLLTFIYFYLFFISTS